MFPDVTVQTEHTPATTAGSGISPPDRRRWLILAVLCLAVTIIFVDETILNVVLPDLVRELRSTSAELQWAVDAYLIVYASLLFPAGNLADRYGRRKLLLIGLVIFGAGSVFAMTATTPGLLIVGRVIMGVGGAAMLPTTLSIIMHVFPEHERVKAIGVWAGASGLGILVGPVVAGWLITHFWWGAVFSVNLPIVAVCIAGTVWLVPESRDPVPKPMDRLGAGLIVVGLATVLYAIIEFPSRGIANPVVAGAFIFGVACLVGFVRVAGRLEHPSFDVAVFKSRSVAASTWVMFVGFAALIGSSFTISQYVQLYLHRSPIAVAAVFGATTVAWGVASVGVASVVGRVGHRVVVSSMMLFTAFGYLLMAVFARSTSIVPLTVAATIQGFAMGAAITPVTEWVMAALPSERSGMASALNDAARQVGAALGVAVFGSVLAALYVHELPGAVQGPARENFAHAVEQGGRVLDQSAQAFATGYVGVMAGCAVVCAVVAVYAASIRWERD